MDNKKIPTWLGTVIIIIFAATVGAFIWKVVKNQEVAKQSQTINANVSTTKQGTVDIQNDQSQQPNKDSVIPTQSRLTGNGCYEMKNGQPNPYTLRKDFNNDTANTYVHYENKEFGISFDIPYNKNWGNADCAVSSYIQRSDVSKNDLMVDFGLFKAWLGDSYHFNIEDSMSAKNIINAEKNNGSPDPNPRIEAIGQYKVVVYESYGMGISRIYQILGDKHNYVFTESHIDGKNGGSMSESSELKKVIKSFKAQ